LLRSGSVALVMAGGKALKARQLGVARIEKNYYGAGIESRLEMLLPRMS
jgi:hypothetical protein